MKEFLNEDLKVFRDLTPEQRSAIVEAKLNGDAELYSLAYNGWHFATLHDITFDVVYRTKPKKKLVIPWEIIKPEYKWAAMDESGCIRVFVNMPYACERAWVLGFREWDVITCLSIDSTGIDWQESLVQRPE